jgi:hypothetical protein
MILKYKTALAEMNRSHTYIFQIHQKFTGVSPNLYVACL